MPENLSSFKVFCQGGLNTSRDVLSQGETQPGSAVSLINYEPAVTGGYRKISGYSNDYGTVPGTNKVLGVCVANGVNDGILAARYNAGNTNYLYRWNNSSSAWVAITTPASVNVSTFPKVRFSRYNWGTSKVVITDGVNRAATYDGTTYTQITNTNAPSAPKVSHVFKNHLFLAGDATESTNLWFSAPYSETDFDPADGAGVINVGFSIVAIKSFRDALYVFGSNNIRKLVGNNIADFVLEEVTDDLGCLATDSVVEIGGDLLFLSQDGLRPVTGTDKIGDVNLETVSKDIQSIFTDLVFEVDLDKLDAVVIRQKTQFRYFLGAADGQGIIGGFRQTPNGLQFEYGQMLGVFTTCATSGYIGQDEFVIHGDSNGKVQRQEIGNDFDGEAIFSVFQTPFFHMQDPEQRKVFYTVATYLRSEGDNELIMSALYDYEDVDTLRPTNFTLTTKGAASYYNEALYNSTAIFDGNPAPVRRTNISGSGMSASFKYVTNDTNASHSIQGIVVTFGVGDRL
tara:strand:+ start:4983 stop:6521 length:1539 start_codon:yes stop_codon:yes gene_type:complete